jgi:hypothetical protein
MPPRNLSGAALQTMYQGINRDPEPTRLRDYYGQDPIQYQFVVHPSRLASIGVTSPITSSAHRLMLPYGHEVQGRYYQALSDWQRDHYDSHPSMGTVGLLDFLRMVSPIARWGRDFQVGPSRNLVTVNPSGGLVDSWHLYPDNSRDHGFTFYGQLRTEEHRYAERLEAEPDDHRYWSSRADEGTPAPVAALQEMTTSWARLLEDD